jgi:hypothetical protein
MRHAVVSLLIAATAVWAIGCVLVEVLHHRARGSTLSDHLPASMVLRSSFFAFDEFLRR